MTLGLSRARQPTITTLASAVTVTSRCLGIGDGIGCSCRLEARRQITPSGAVPVRGFMWRCFVNDLLAMRDVFVAMGSGVLLGLWLVWITGGFRK